MAENVWDSKIECMPLKELKDLQLKRLKKMVDYVFRNNRFYRDRLKEAKISSDNIRSLKDIEKIPFITKQDLRGFYPFGLVCTEIDDIVEVHASSGTTGKPVVGPYTKNDVELWAEVMARSLWANGLRKHDIMQNAYGYGLFTGAHGFEKGAQKIGAVVITISSGNTKRQITIMKDFGTTALVCTPSYSMYMAETAEFMGLNPLKDFNLKIGCFGAEAWSEEMRSNVEKRWGIIAHEHYGLTEIIGPGIVSECKYKKLHINADHFLPEVINPDTGETLSPGEEGELVFTTLTKEGMPILRYRTRDIAKIYDQMVCECGRTHVKHSTIKGRSDDMLIIRGTNIYPGQIESVLMKNSEVGGNWRMVLTTEEDVDTLTVEVESKAPISQLEAMDLENSLKNQIKSVIVFTPRVTVLPPNSIPQAGLKAKRVVDQRKKE